MFFHTMGYVFILLMVSFSVQNFLIWMLCHLFILCVCLFPLLKEIY